MSDKMRFVVAAGLRAAMAAGCANKSPKVTTINAPKQEYTPKGSAKPWVIGGVYDKKDRSLAIVIHDNPVMRGSMAGSVPKTRLMGTYDAKAVQGTANSPARVRGVVGAPALCTSRSPAIARIPVGSR